MLDFSFAEIAIVLVIALVVLGGDLLVMTAAGQGRLHWAHPHPAQIWQVLGLAVLFVIQGSAEEVVLRGHLMQTVAARWGIIAGVSIQAVLFAVLHSANPGVSVVAVVNIALFGLMLGVMGGSAVAAGFALRVYVPQDVLDGIYQPLVPAAVPPEEGSAAQLEEQLARLAVAEDGSLPPRFDALWRLPSSAAPAHPGEGPPRPLFHPSQRLRRSLQLFAAAEEGDQDAALLSLLLPHDEVAGRARSAAPEQFLPQYARQSDWTVPLSWFALFLEEDLVRTPFRGRMRHRLIGPAVVASRRAAQAAVGLLRGDHAVERDGDLQQ